MTPAPLLRVVEEPSTNRFHVGGEGASTLAVAGVVVSLAGKTPSLAGKGALPAGEEALGGQGVFGLSSGKDLAFKGDTFLVPERAFHDKVRKSLGFDGLAWYIRGC